VLLRVVVRVDMRTSWVVPVGALPTTRSLGSGGTGLVVAAVSARYQRR